MLTDDVASAIGLTGGEPTDCPGCATTHWIIIYPETLTVCRCGWAYAIKQIDEHNLAGIWIDAAEARKRLQAEMNDLPYTQ